MMHGRGKSDAAIVAGKSAEQGRAIGCGTDGAKGGAMGNVDHKSRAGHRTGKACHKRWNAYDKQQGKGRRNGSPRSFTTSMSIFSGSRSSS